MVPGHSLEMRPKEMNPAHKTGSSRVGCSILSISRYGDGSGILKDEMRRLDSLVIRAAEASEFRPDPPAVDREQFSVKITQTLDAIEIESSRGDHGNPHRLCLIFAPFLCHPTSFAAIGG